MLDILSIIPSKKRNTPSGWITFNCVCCVHLGHKADRRSRGGIKFEGNQNWIYNCFNCNYRCGFTIGKAIPQKTRKLLEWCGIDTEQVQRWSLESLEKRDLIETLLEPTQRKRLEFKKKELPDGAVLVNPDDHTHSTYVKYLHKRGLKTTDYPFMVTPRAGGRNRNRIIVPYTHRNVIVGHTSRYCDNKTPKYINDQQPGYVFGYDLQRPEWSIAIVVEGIFDALSINGLAVMHNTISPEQQLVISGLNKRVIVVPDHDTAGMELMHRALECGYSVSLPQWHPGVKDVNDAVVKYGKLPTLLSIIQCATTSAIKLEMRRRKLGVK